MLRPKLAAAQAQLDTLSMKKPIPRHRILVVDDDLPYARRVVELLCHAGYDASAIHSAQDAIAAVLISSPDLAIVDVRLPGGSGLFLGAALHSKFGVPFVISSGLDDLETAQQATQTGAIACLVKSSHLQHYLPTVNAALASSNQLRESRQREQQLSKALQQTRAVSTATGVLMERSCLSRDQAVGRLRGIARAQRRRLSDVAEQFLNSVECLNGTIDAAQRPLTR
jgi:AmiR/NasT family two-component response regulator